VDVLTPQATPALRDRLLQIDGVEVEVAAGAIREHVDFNTAAPPLNHRYVRRALAMAVDREALADQLLGSLSPDIEPLNNVLWLSNQAPYEDHWSDHVRHDPAAAQRLLVTNGCTLPGDVWRCEGQDLELDFATTSDMPLRSEQFAMIASDLEAISVRLRARTAPSQVAFDPSFLASDTKWDLFNFARRGTANPLDAGIPWRCDTAASVNNTKYCNHKVDRLFDIAAEAVNERRRNKALNTSDALIAGDVPTLPLYQRPALLVWNSLIEGPQNNPSEWGPLWNVGEWFLTQ
jgi:peptide/nickel transport system substrate-binding protein